MPRDKHHLLLVCSHPVQYMSPLFRLMARHPQLDILVAYCSLQGAEKGPDPGFGVEIAWDTVLLEGYPWVHVPNRSPGEGIGNFWGLINPGLWKLIRKGRFAGVLVYGHAYFSFWLAICAAKLNGSALILASDATSLAPRDGKSWKFPVKRWLLPRILRLADVLCAPSSGTVRFFRSLGISPWRVFLTHYAVDNGYFTRMAGEADRVGVRRGWDVPAGAAVVLFAAKLQPWKRPRDLLHAFAQAGVEEAHLVFAGEGPLREELEAEARALGIAGRVRFLGFVNQSQMAAVYIASDLLVLPSAHEPWGLVVNEAMVCGVPAVVSDRVGARHDLIQEGETGFTFPCGDVKGLAAILRQALPDRRRLRHMGAAARTRMATWSYRECLDGYLHAFDRAVTVRTARA